MERYWLIPASALCMILISIGLLPIDAADQTLIGVGNQGLELGFPESWNGDAYRNVSCRVSEIPEWLDGYFVALVNGAYGRLSDPNGSKLTHMFDGLAALASIQFKDGMVRFSGRYLPTRAYKIWDFYGRDMSRSHVAWSTLRSPHMASAKEKWDHIAADYLSHNPNMNLWKIAGSRVVAVAEHPQIGLQFDVASLSDFQLTDLHDTNDLFTGRSSVKLVSMAAHSKPEPDGTVYATVSGVEPSTNRMYQFIFRISPKGVRTLEGAFEYGRYESSKCGSDQRYMGDKRVLAGLVKSVVSTNQFLIIPITSAIVNPCKYKAKNRKYYPRHDLDRHLVAALIGNNSESENAQAFSTAVEFGTDVPLRFLIFDKKKRQFVTNRPLDSYPPRFVTHPLNAYEMDENRIVIDMITYDNYETYDRSLFLEYILRDSIQSPIRTRPVRFTLDIQRGYIERTHLVPDTVQAPMEYPAINPKYNGRRYRYAYVVQPPFTLGSQLGKINVEEHSGAKNLYFSHGPSAVLSEPTFVPRPNADSEDDGVLLTLGLEMLSKRSVLYVVDAKTMKEVGRAEMPVIVPFGFHARYFDRQELTEQPQTENQPAESIDSIFSKIYPSLAGPWNPPKEDPTEKNEKPELTPIVIVQHSNSDDDPKTSVSTSKEPSTTQEITTEARTTPSTTTLSFASWFSASTPDPVAQLPTVPPADLSTRPAIDLGPGAEPNRVYLNNGTIVEMFADGSVKSYPASPNYALPFYPTAAMPVTMKPPYLGIEPAFIQFVKSQIPPPHMTFTVPAHPPPAAVTAASAVFPVPGQNQVLPAPAPASDTKVSSTNPISTTPYPRFIFPGYYGTKATTTPFSAVPKSSKVIPEKGNNASFIVVDVIVDPSKRTRRPQPSHAIADDPAPPSPKSAKSTTTTTEEPEEPSDEETESTSPSEAPKSTSSSTQQTPVREIIAAVAANDAVGRFFQQGKHFLCNFFGKAITALGSEFCKVQGEAAEERIGKAKGRAAR